MIRGTIVRHPAKYSDEVIDTLRDFMLGLGGPHHLGRVLDPFAGPSGKLDILDVDWTGVEIEPEWATHPRVLVGDAHHLPFRDGSFQTIITSPCYGNRMADCHNARDRCKACAVLGPDVNPNCRDCKGTGLSRRNTYRAALGHMPNPNSSATLQWGEKYKVFHRLAWQKAVRALADDGLFILNVSDHVRRWRVEPVSQWHYHYLHNVLRLSHVGILPVKTPRNRQGENGGLRVGCEWIFILRKVPNAPLRLSL